VAHLTFLVFCLLTNIIVTSMLILGGAAVVNGLTGGSKPVQTCGQSCWSNVVQLPSQFLLAVC
jgi:hypothetical protein